MYCKYFVLVVYNWVYSKLHIHTGFVPRPMPAPQALRAPPHPYVKVQAALPHQAPTLRMAVPASRPPFPSPDGASDPFVPLPPQALTGRRLTVHTAPRP